MNLIQLQFRRDFKKLCMERALERCDYDRANIYSAQLDWFDRQIDSAQLHPLSPAEPGGDRHVTRGISL